MQTLYYPDLDKEPAPIDYGVRYRKDASAVAGVDLILIHSKRLGLPSASLIARNDSRDFVLNRLLSAELAGIRIDRIRFFVLIDAQDFGKTLGFEFPIEIDFADYQRRGNPYYTDRPIPPTWRGRALWALGYRPARYSNCDEDLTAGCARCCTPFDRRRHPAPPEVLSLCESVGHLALGKALPKWLKDSVAVSGISSGSRADGPP